MSFPFYCIPHSHIRVQKSLGNNHVHRWCFLCFFFQVVVVHYSLPYASLKHEICEDGSMLCGMEIQLPLIEPFSAPRQLFFRACAESTEVSTSRISSSSYLQILYGLVVIVFKD